MSVNRKIMTWTEYNDSITKIFNELENIISTPTQLEIVTLVRGGLIPAVTISNLYQTKYQVIPPVNITKYQRIDGTDEDITCYFYYLKWSNKILLLIDDILDSGKSLCKLIEKLNGIIEKNKIIISALFAYPEAIDRISKKLEFFTKNTTQIKFVVPNLLYERQWIVFPWETLEIKLNKEE